MIDGRLVFTTPFNRVIALDADLHAGPIPQAELRIGR